MMLKVAAMVKLPRVCASYKMAHDVMATFVKENRGKVAEGDSLVISFSETTHVTASFLFGVSEYVKAHEEFQWSIKHSTLPDGPDRLMELVPGLQMLPATVTPYVERKVELL